MKTRLVLLDFDDIKNPLISGGQALATYEVFRRLTEKYSITVISSKYPGYQDRTQDGIMYKHIGLGSSSIRLNNLVYDLLMPFVVPTIKTDLIIEYFIPPYSTLFSPLFTHIPIVAIPTFFDAQRLSEKYHLPFFLIERFGSRFYKYFLPSAKYLDEKMKRYNPNIISDVVPQGVSDEYFKIIQKNPSYILFLGRYDINQKGIDLLLHSYAKIADKITYPLVLAGRGPDERKIIQIINKLGLDRKVRLIGPAYGKKKMDLLSKALFVTIPSRNEGFCIFALEALAAGLPLVCFDIPGLNWITPKVSLKAKSFNVDHYARLLLDMSQKTMRSKMTPETKKIALKFTWNKVAEKYDKFFRFVLHSQTKPIYSGKINILSHKEKNHAYTSS